MENSMFFDDYSWQKVTGAQMEAFLKLINPIQGRHSASPKSAALDACHPSFYASVTLMRVNDRAWAPNTGPFWFLAKPDVTLPLDGTSAPIHEANERDPIKITEKNALDYLRFFCYFVHGDEGPFLIIEDINHPGLDRGKLDNTTRKEIEGSLRKATFEGKTPGGALRASATLLYGSGLFFAQFSMTENGMVEMINDEPLAADLPVKPIKSD